MNRLTIGTVTALLAPDEATSTPDDRQSLEKTFSYSGGAIVPGVLVVDGGTVASGRVDSYSGVKFSAADWATVLGYATNRTMVSVTGLDGVTVASCRVRVKQYQDQRRFNTVIADLEIWRV